MKKFKYFFLCIIFFTGILIGYENPEIVNNLKKNIKYFLKINKLEKKQNISTKTFDDVNDYISANSFEIIKKKIGTFSGLGTSFILTDADNYKIVRTDGKLETNDEVLEINNVFSFFSENRLNGGIRSFFIIDNQEYVLESNKKLNCYYASIIKVSSKETLLKSDCLPDEDNLDFSGLGGGYTINGEYFYLAIGTPTHSSDKIDELAQDSKSIFGKVLKIKLDEFSKLNKNLNYKIYSFGHRNPQGIIFINNRLYEIEHGPRGGDEINLIKENENYGWPIYSIGASYDRKKKYKNISIDKDFVNPIYSFSPAIAPSDIAACPQNLKKYYNNLDCLMILSLRGQSIFVVLIDHKNNKIFNIERIILEERLRKFGRNVDSNLFIDKNDFFYIITDQNNIYKVKFNNFIINKND